MELARVRAAVEPNAVEGSEAALLVRASGSRGGWRRSAVAAVAGLATLAPFAVGLHFLFQLPGTDIDHAPRRDHPPARVDEDRHVDRNGNLLVSGRSFQAIERYSDTVVRELAALGR